MNLTTLDYQINVAYEIDVVVGILFKINKRSLWNKRSLVIFDWNIPTFFYIKVIKYSMLQLIHQTI